MHGKRGCWVILTLLLALLWVLPAQAAGQEEVIQVAIPVPTEEAERETSAAYISYTLEYLHEIAQYTGWDYEVLQVPGTYEQGLQKALSMLREGTADLVAPVQYSQSLEEGICFSQNSYATGTTVLQIPNEIYTGRDLGKDLTVAVVRGSGMEAIADEFFAKNDITARYVLCRGVEEQSQLVIDGQADVMLNSSLESVPDVSVVAEFSPQSLYFAAGDPALLQQLDSAIIYIKQANPLFSMDLYKNNLSDSSQALTQEERAFIQRAQPYVVAVLDHNAPYQYADAQTGQLGGIGVDILKKIAQQTGLVFEFVLVDSWDELLTLLQEKEVQVVVGMPYSYDFGAAWDLTITRSYASSPYVLLAKEGFDGPHPGQKLAQAEVNAYTEGKYVGEMTPYPSIEDCVEAVRLGEADYTYVDLYTAQYYLGDFRYNGMSFTPQTYTPRSICFGLAKPTAHELLSILNKSINQLSDTETQNIITQNVNPPRDISIGDVIVGHPLQSLIIIGAVSAVIAGLLIFLLWRKERISRSLRRKAMEDGLTHLYNASACRKLISQKLRQRRGEHPGAFLIMDLDHFKEINDNHGHHTGDRILQRFAALLRDTLREDSVIARIGGDEFVVYLDSVKEEENISAICQRICSQAHSISVAGTAVTVSIGAVAVEEKDSYDTLYRLADKALYEAKAAQRDRFCLARREEA